MSGSERPWRNSYFVTLKHVLTKIRIISAPPKPFDVLRAMTGTCPARSASAPCFARALRGGECAACEPRVGEVKEHNMNDNTLPGSSTLSAEGLHML